MGASHTLKIAPEIQAIIGECSVDGLILRLPDRQLDRKVYTDVKKVMEARGGKWNTSKKGFVFPTAADVEVVRGVPQGGVIIRDKVVRQAFYTPMDVADRVVDEALKHSVLLKNIAARFLEPECGDGALIEAILRRVPKARIDAYDIDKDAVANAQRAVMEKFMPAKGQVIIECQDFLAVDDYEYTYDLIIMNPPFQNGQVKAHVLKAMKMSHPKTVIACISPTNFVCPVPHGGSSEWVAEYIKLGAGAFKESGTNIDTQLMLAHRAT